MARSRLNRRICMVELDRFCCKDENAVSAGMRLFARLPCGGLVLRDQRRLIPCRMIVASRLVVSRCW